MRMSMLAAFAVVAVLGAAAPSVAADQFAVLRPAQKMTPRSAVEPAACTFWQCNCQRVCILSEGERCLQYQRTCDVCSKCDD